MNEWHEIRRLEELSMSAWPALQTHLYDGWVLRFSNGYTKRANSINLLYTAFSEVEEKILYCERFYQKLKLPVVFKIVSEDSLAVIDKTLELLDYTKLDETLVETLDLEQRTFNCNIEVKVEEQLSDEWINGYIKNIGIQDDIVKTTLETMLRQIVGKCIFASYIINDTIVGFGYGVMDQGYVGLFDIVIDEKYRGHKYSKAVINTILSKAKEQGCHTAYLQVVKENAIAMKLYNKLGFKEKYRYWYRLK